MTSGPEHSRRRVLGAVTGAAAGWAATSGIASAAPPHSRDDAAPGPGRRTARDRELLVAILLYDGFTALDAVGPYEVLCRVPGVRVAMVAQRPGPVRTDTGELTLHAERAMRDCGRPDVLLVPGGSERGTVAALRDPAVLAWIRRVHRHTVWTTSVCTGALVLGSAGLLRGLPATTYWAARASLEDLGAVWTPERFVESGKIITAAGVSAGIDMGLHLAARLSDERTAQAIQLGVEYDPRPPFDTGSPEKAGPELRRLALELMDAAAR
ncbi:thiamine biosynthesis protein ThiJ [Streptomyces albus subsp. albus]|nr:thiamine biosynthesis protein ThiJ [Streptomyces albus subsp. albus]